MLIRSQQSNDGDEVRRVNDGAFGRADESELVDRLRAAGDVLLSLVAEVDGVIVGHVLFSRMWIETTAGDIRAVALAPLAVLPGHQRRGIGAELVQYGLTHLRACSERIAIVLGDPDYYSRFGFSADAAAGLASPFPPEAFMALELEPGAMEGVRGKVRYPAAFGL